MLATGEKHTVREFVEQAFAQVNRRIEWRGSGMDEKGIDARSGQVLIEIDAGYFRPVEVDRLGRRPLQGASASWLAAQNQLLTTW